MSFFTLVAVFIFEHIQPLPYRLVVLTPLSRLAAALELRLNGGEAGHGRIAWLLACGGTVVFVGGVYFALYAMSPLLAWVWNILMLYLSMGFREHNERFNEIQFALRMDDLPSARQGLAAWRGIEVERLSASEVAGRAIETLLCLSLRHVFGVLACFVLLPGPCGAVLYRVAAVLGERWRDDHDEGLAAFRRFAQRAFGLIDAGAARVTAATFAVVGNFEDAVYCWRTLMPNENTVSASEAIVLSAGAGALGIRLSGLGDDASAQDSGRSEPPGLRAPDVDAMQSALGLLWRGLFLWLILFLLTGVARFLAA